MTELATTKTAIEPKVEPKDRWEMKEEARERVDRERWEQQRAEVAAHLQLEKQRADAHTTEVAVNAQHLEKMQKFMDAQAARDERGLEQYAKLVDQNDRQTKAFEAISAALAVLLQKANESDKR